MRKNNNSKNGNNIIAACFGSLRKTSILGILCIMAVLTVGCQKEEVFQGENTSSSQGTTTPTVIPVLKATPASFPNLSAAGEEQEVVIISNQNWTATSSAAWCKLAKTYGTGNDTLRFAIQAQTVGDSARQATITIAAASGNVVITLSQTGLRPNLILDPSAILVKGEGESKTITITANTAWKVSKRPSWCEVSTVSGEKSGVLTIRVSANNSYEKRSDVLTISTSSVSESVQITQEGIKPSISSFFPASGGANTEITITGTNFSAIAAENNVTINGVKLTVTSVSATQIKAVVPKDKACSGLLSLVAAESTVKASGMFTYKATSSVITLAGGVQGFQDAKGSAARFSNPVSVSVSPTGEVYVSDEDNNRIRKIQKDGTVNTLVGSTQGYQDANSTAAKFNSPAGLLVDEVGNVYVADAANHCVRKMNYYSPLAVKTMAGSKEGYKDATGKEAMFDFPKGVALDRDYNVYVVDYQNHCIRKVTPQGVVTTFAGANGEGYTNGNAAKAQFSHPSGIAIDKSGNVYVADKGNHCIRVISPNGTVSTLAGGSKGNQNGKGTAAKFNSPTSVAVDAAGNVYVADQGNHCIRKITTAGEVTTVAGTGVKGFKDGDVSSAQFDSPSAVAVDGSGDLYIADMNNHRIRKIAVE